MSFDIMQIHKQNQNSKRYTSRWNAEITQLSAGGPWSEEELKLPRYMRSTSSSRQRLKENMLSNGAKNSSHRVSHRRTVPVLHSEREAFHKHKKDSVYPYREYNQSYFPVINDSTDYQASNETIVEEQMVQSESLCVAIKRRLTSWI